MWVPSHDQSKLQTAIGTTSAHRTSPVDQKRSIDQKLEERLSNLACVLALRKSNPMMVMNPMTSKFPVHGHKNPS